MHTPSARLTLAALMLGIAGPVQAQELPTSQPKYLDIIREEVKIGRTADHAKIEAGWPVAYERAKSPNYYLAMVSMTGPNEAWFIVPHESNTAMDATMKREEADKRLTAEFDRLSKADAEVLNNVRILKAMARPDLSHGAYPDLAKQRFWDITWFRVRPGHEQKWESAVKTYIAASKRVAPDARFRVYQIIAGMPSPTFLLFGSAESYADFDKMAGEGEKTWMSMTADEMALMQKFSAEGLINAETNRFRLNPTMSYVSRAVRQSDPSFWMPRKATVASTGSAANTQP